MIVNVFISSFLNGLNRLIAVYQVAFGANSAMKQRKRIYYTTEQRELIWDRPSNQSCGEPSICTSSPSRDRRRRSWCPSLL